MLKLFYSKLCALFFTKFFDWFFTQILPNKNFSPTIKRKLAEAKKLKKQELYGPALDVYKQAQAMCPNNPSIHIRKAACYIELGRLGKAISELTTTIEKSKSCKRKSQAYDMISGVFFKLYRQNRSCEFLMLALNFADRATHIAPHDALNAWNRTELLCEFYGIYRKQNQANKAEYIKKHIRAGLQALIELGISGKGNADRYWDGIIRDARQVLPGEGWAQRKIKEMTLIHKDMCENRGSTPRNYTAFLIHHLKQHRVPLILGTLIISSALAITQFVYNPFETLDQPSFHREESGIHQMTEPFAPTDSIRPQTQPVPKVIHCQNDVNHFGDDDDNVRIYPNVDPQLSKVIAKIETGLIYLMNEDSSTAENGRVERDDDELA
jgi:hypothetical protein